MKVYIKNCLKNYYLIEVAMLHRLLLGADMNASVYKVQSSDKKLYFVKVKQGHFNDVSLTILELLQSASIQELILPIKTIAGNLTQKNNNFTLIVYPFVEGQDGFHCSLNHQQWMQFGKTLWEIHNIEVPQSIQTCIRREDFSPKQRNAVKYLYTQIEKIKITDETGIKLKKLLKKYKATIEQMVNFSEKISKNLLNQPLKFVLCHSDIHGGNILLSENNTFYIVDWDDPIMAPKERDLMFIGGGVGNVWNQQHEKELFYKGYGNAKVNEIILAYYRFERIIEDVAEYSQELLLNEDSNKDREQMYKEFADQFKPHGVIDLAFRTYNKKMVQ